MASFYLFLVLVYISLATGQRYGDIDLTSCRVRFSECPQTKFTFPNRNQITDWIRVTEPIPDVTEASLCFWITAPSSSSSTAAVLSYANSVHNNAFLIFFDKGKLHVFTSSENPSTALPITARTHVCVVISRSNGFAKVFHNGTMHARLSYSSRSPILGGGSVVIGQEQDNILGGFEADQSFSGTIENLMMWYRTLDDNEIISMYNNRCSCPRGYAIALTHNQIQLEGRVRSLPVSGC